MDFLGDSREWADFTRNLHCLHWCRQYNDGCLESLSQHLVFSQRSYNNSSHQTLPGSEFSLTYADTSSILSLALQLPIWVSSRTLYPFCSPYVSKFCGELVEEDCIIKTPSSFKSLQEYKVGNSNDYYVSLFFHGAPYPRHKKNKDSAIFDFFWQTLYFSILLLSLLVKNCITIISNLGKFCVYISILLPFMDPYWTFLHYMKSTLENTKNHCSV